MSFQSPDSNLIPNINPSNASEVLIHVEKCTGHMSFTCAI